MNNRSEPVIQVEQLSHQYTDNDAQSIINNLSLAIRHGESVALIGRSGCGKSTLLNLLSGLEPIQHGEAKVLGNIINDMNDKARTVLRRRHIGFIYQAFNLIPTLNVADNVTLPLALDNTPKTQRQAALEPLLDAIGLASRMTDYPDRLSGGEQQRVAIARALIHKPDIILADEPTGNLDADSGRHILKLLQSLIKEQQGTMLLVTHSLEVAKMADRVFAMQQGQLTPLTLDQLDGSSAW